MTIRDFLAENKPSRGINASTGEEVLISPLDWAEVWDNAACKGYAIMAMEFAGLDAETIDRVLSQFPYAFDDPFDGRTIDDAAEYYRDW